MKPSLHLRAAQQLALTPQLQQSIKLLQLSTADLEEEVERFLAENPLLEIEERQAPDASLSASVSHQSQEALESDDRENAESGIAENWAQSTTHTRADDEHLQWAAQQTKPTSLRDHLHEQAAALPLSERDRAWLEILIESLDEDGYLRETLGEVEGSIANAFEEAFGQRLDPDEMELGLTFLQQMDPIGVGARTLAECLSLQLEAKKGESGFSLASKLVCEPGYLEMLGHRDFKELCKLLACGKEDLKEAQELIQTLQPRPGSKFSDLAAQTIIPDVIAYRSGSATSGRWQVRLNESAVPKLSINAAYADLIRQDKSSSMASQLQEARWFIKNIAQRFDTILRVAQAIAKEQQAFFEKGALAMRPLVLRDIAYQCELHESTVSRVTTNKYMLTPQGTFELKYFFASHVATDAGGTASSTAIRARIKEWIGAEDSKKPLSDQQIADRFAQEGIQVARRTIAKYREALRIEPVSQRKKL